MYVSGQRGRTEFLWRLGAGTISMIPYVGPLAQEEILYNAGYTSYEDYTRNQLYNFYGSWWRIGGRLQLPFSENSKIIESYIRFLKSSQNYALGEYNHLEFLPGGGGGGGSWGGPPGQWK